MVKRKKINSKVLSDLFFYIYKFNNKILRKIILRISLTYDGGEFFSTILRRIYKSYHGVDIGMYSYGCFNQVNFPRGTKIGRYCSFARGSALIPGNHPAKFKSLHPFFYNPELGVVNELKIVRTQFSIGHDVWIGTNVLILPKVLTIGTGAIIGAGSVVTHSVPPFAIVAGNPAKILKYRFSKDTINDIIESRWWEKDIDDIVDELDFINLFTKNIE